MGTLWLFYHQVEVGTIAETEGEFPTRNGIFQPSQRSDFPEVREQLKNWIAYTIAYEGLSEQDRKEGSDQASLYAAEHEEAVYEVLDSEAWLLVSEDGQAEPILCPWFYPDGTVSWRWNFDRWPEQLPEGPIRILQQAQAKAVEIYRQIATNVNTPANAGKWVLIELGSGDYEVEDEPEAAWQRLNQRQPGGEIISLKIGCVYHQLSFVNW